jgi:hypothetical protein
MHANRIVFKLVLFINTMALEIAGKIIQILPEQTGNGKNGPWTKQDFIIETQEQYPRKICFSAWNDKASQVKSFNNGTLVNVSFNAESREFNGRWYTDLKIWKIESQTTQVQGQTAPDPTEMYEPLAPGELTSEPNDLPF